jgi:arsenate reductase
MATGIATFETNVPNWDDWNKKVITSCRLVALKDDIIAGFAILAQVSQREVYKGVAEVTLYVGSNFKGQHIGETLLNALIIESEHHGFWTLNAAIFSENIPSINLHKKCGFRIVGLREKLGQRHGKWHDNYLLERRSKKIGIETSSVEESKKTNTMKNILVLCTGNSCRSQMAHGYLNQLTKGTANIYSAGIETHGINQGAVSIMKEDGIDISQHTSNHVDEYAEVDFDYIITVCDHANENCPYIPSKNAVRLHHNFFDPSKVVGSEVEKHAAFEKARNEIKNYFKKFVANNLSF